MELACCLQSITWWGFWDGKIWTPGCGIVRADGTPKASGAGRHAPLAVVLGYYYPRRAVGGAERRRGLAEGKGRGL